MMVDKLVVAFAAGVLLLQAPPSRLYRDPGGRFTFSYPSSFGSTSPGTNDGFRDRVAAVRFAQFPARLKGEAVLTRGFPLLDFQAVGGVYDGITLEILPDSARAPVLAQLPPLSAATLCQALGQPTHVDPGLPAFAAMPPLQRAALVQIDTMRNINPHVVRCQSNGDVIVFDKERSVDIGGPVQHVFGAVRFLSGPYSTFQVVAGGDPPDATLLTALGDVVTSFVAN